MKQPDTSDGVHALYGLVWMSMGYRLVCDPFDPTMQRLINAGAVRRYGRRGWHATPKGRRLVDAMVRTLGDAFPGEKA